MAQREVTTIQVSREFKRNRLDALMPYSSLTYEEFLSEMCDVYEERER
jgi:hypothetical protein